MQLACERAKKQTHETGTTRRQSAVSNKMKLNFMKINILTNIATLMLAAGTFTACGIYKSYERPEDIQSQSTYRLDQMLDVKADADSLPGEKVGSTDFEKIQDSNHLGFMPWKDIFTDPQLQALIQKGLDSNFDLRNAVLQVRQMQARLAKARLSFTPSLNINGTEGFNGVVGIGGNQYAASPSNTYGVGATASWEIDVFGKLLNAKRGAVADFLQSDAARRSVQTQVISGIASAYYSLLMLDRQLEISKQTVQNWNTSIQMMEAMKNAGGYSAYNQAAIEQAKANSMAVRAGIPDLERQIRELENSLCLLVGMPGQTIERGRFENQTVPSQFSVGVPSQMFLNRPDVVAAEAQLMSAYAATAAARAAFLPGFNITASGSWTNSLGTLIADPAQFVWQAVASLALPIFNQGTNRANLRVAKAQQEIAANNFKQTLLSAANEVSNALFQYQSSGAKCQYRVEQIQSLEKAVDYTTQLMQLGSSTYLEVLTAQQSLLSAQLSQVSDQYERMNSVITLYRALGGGAQEEVEGVDYENYDKPKSVRKRTKAAETQVKALIKQEKAEAKAAKQAERQARNQ